MLLSDYDYCLPHEAIAQTPLEDRSASRLLVLDKESGDIEHAVFSDLPDILDAGDCLVMNNTQVTARRLRGKKLTSGRVEALVLRHVGGADYEVLLKPANRLRIGTKIEFEGGVYAEVVGETEVGGRVLRFHDAESLNLAEIGEVPLPPYIHVPLSDESRYQTTYGSEPGSAAAPTAGLHFTDALLRQIRSKGVSTAAITLDISIDTFRPVQAEDLSGHVMHGEAFSIEQECAEAVATAKGRIVAVGTTSARALETAAVGRRKLRPGPGTSKLFIRPGHRFQAVDALITNFHMPKTTMLMMVAALCSREMLLKSYEIALAAGYRFLSFGDAMIVINRGDR